MGKLEESSRKKAKKGEVQKIILESVKLAGLLSIGLVAPNVIKAMKQVGLIAHERQDEVVRSLAARLVDKGLLEFNGKYYEITGEGEKRLRMLEFTNHQLPKQKKWDKKWRVIIFDIPEKKKKVRDQVRRIFVSAGLRRLQDSVWIYPYDCEDIMGLLKTDLGIGRNLLYLIVDEVENDKYLREEFKLKKF